MALRISLWCSNTKEQAKLNLISQMMIDSYGLHYHLMQSDYGFDKVFTLQFLELINYLDTLNKLIGVLPPENQLGITLKMNLKANASKLKLIEIRPNQVAIATNKGSVSKVALKNLIPFPRIHPDLSPYLHELSKYFYSLFYSQNYHIQQYRPEVHKMYLIIEGDLNDLKNYLTQNQLQNSFSKPKPLTEVTNNNNITPVTRHDLLFS